MQDLYIFGLYILNLFEISNAKLYLIETKGKGHQIIKPDMKPNGIHHLKDRPAATGSGTDYAASTSDYHDGNKSKYPEDVSVESTSLTSTREDDELITSQNEPDRKPMYQRMLDNPSVGQDATQRLEKTIATPIASGADFAKGANQERKTMTWTHSNRANTMASRDNFPSKTTSHGDMDRKIIPSEASRPWSGGYREIRMLSITKPVNTDFNGQSTLKTNDGKEQSFEKTSETFLKRNQTLTSDDKRIEQWDIEDLDPEDVKHQEGKFYDNVIYETAGDEASSDS